MRQIQLLAEAEQDLWHGFTFYEGQREGLGQYFLDSLFSDIESLQLFSGVHGTVNGYHRMLSKRFPYAMYYTLRDDNNILVVAVLDCRQAPGRALRKLSDR